MSFDSNPRAKARRARKEFTRRDLRAMTGSRKTRRAGVKAVLRAGVNAPYVKPARKALAAKLEKLESDGWRLVRG